MPDLNLPAHLLNRLQRNLAGQLAASLPTGNVPYISIRSNRFTLYDAAGNERSVGIMDQEKGLSLDVCIVDSNPHISKVYYDKPYDPNGEDVPPTCFSDNGIGASAQAIKPQSKDCKSCPHNQWGSETSRMTGKATKACNDVQKVAVVVPGQGEHVFLLRVPPASLKHLSKYIQEIGAFSAGGRKVDLQDLVTRIYFHKDANGILGFTPVDFVDEQTAAIGDKAYESKATEPLLGKNDRPYSGEIGVLPAAQVSEQRTLAPPPLQRHGEIDDRPDAPKGVPVTPLHPGPAQEEPKKRGRPRKEPVQGAPATQAPFLVAAAAAGPSPPTNGASATTASPSDTMEEIPSFLKRIEQAPGMQPKPTPSFGMQTAQAAPDDMQSRIAAVLGMKT